MTPRKALEKIHSLVNSLDEECGVDPVEVRDIARDALLEPEQNHERFRSLPDAINAWREVPPDESGPFEEWLFNAAKKTRQKE